VVAEPFGRGAGSLCGLYPELALPFRKSFEVNGNAIHGNTGEGREVAVGDEGFGQDAAPSLSQGDRGGPKMLGPAKYLFGSFRYGDHGGSFFPKFEDRDYTQEKLNGGWGSIQLKILKRT
jgi:hypothetical protein